MPMSRSRGPALHHLQSLQRRVPSPRIAATCRILRSLHQARIIWTPRISQIGHIALLPCEGSSKNAPHAPPESPEHIRSDYVTFITTPPPTARTLSFFIRLFAGP